MTFSVYYVGTRRDHTNSFMLIEKSSYLLPNLTNFFSPNLKQTFPILLTTFLDIKINKYLIKLLILKYVLHYTSEIICIL